MASFADAAAFFASGVDLLRVQDQLVTLRDAHAQYGTTSLAQILHVEASTLQEVLGDLFEAFVEDRDSASKWTHDTYYRQFHQVVKLLCALIGGRTAATAVKRAADDDEDKEEAFESQLDVLLTNLSASLYCRVNASMLGGGEARGVLGVAPDTNMQRKEYVRRLFNCVATSSARARRRVMDMVAHVKALKPAVPSSKGIYNPDSVCYAISTIQLLYALPGYKQAILDANFTFNPSNSAADGSHARAATATASATASATAAVVAQELQKVFALLSPAHSLLDYVEIDAFLEAFFALKKVQARAQAGACDGDGDGDSDDFFGEENQSDAAAFLSELVHAVNIAHAHSCAALDRCSKDEDESRQRLPVHSYQFLQGSWYNVLSGGAPAGTGDMEGQGAASVAGASAPASAPAASASASASAIVNVDVGPNTQSQQYMIKKKEEFHVLKLNIASSCGKPSSDTDENNAYTIESAIKTFFSTQIVFQRWSPIVAAGGTGTDSSLSQQPQQPLLQLQATTRRVEPCRWPPYLFVQPKRFGFNKKTLEKFKTRNTEAKFVFGSQLDLTSFCGGTYTLLGVVIHSGTATDGHYYSFLRQPVGSASEWALCDDDTVAKCSYKRVVCEASAVKVCAAVLTIERISVQSIYANYVR